MHAYHTAYMIDKSVQKAHPPFGHNSEQPLEHDEQVLAAQPLLQLLLQPNQHPKGTTSPGLFRISNPASPIRFFNSSSFIKRLHISFYDGLLYHDIIFVSSVKKLKLQNLAIY